MSGTLLRAETVVTPDGAVEGAWVHIHEGRIAAIGTGPAPAGEFVDLGGNLLVPGYIDLHVHGGGGHDITSSLEELRAAVRFHHAHGTTSTLVSLIAAPVPDMARQLGWVADAVEDPDEGGRVLGAHIEGPFLSTVRCGAQNPAHLLAPDRATLARLFEAARGTMRSVSLAPELPGGLGLVRDVVDGGAVAAIGHTDATYDQALAAIDAGASLATHLFNGMRPMHHREPGVVGAVLRAGIASEIINDGIHVHPAVTAIVAHDLDRLVLVTDAIAAAGLEDGEFELGGRAVRVQDRAALLVENGSLAGSTLTMDDAVRRAVLEGGLPLEVASRAASGNPARVLGLEHEVGAIAPGHRADLVLLDRSLRVIDVMSSGRWRQGGALAVSGLAVLSPEGRRPSGHAPGGAG